MARLPLSPPLLARRLSPCAPVVPRRCFWASPRTSTTFPQNPSRGQITLTTRDPSTKKWSELSAGQKVGRTASTGASLATIAVGLVVTAGVIAFVYLEIVAPNSITSWFNNATERIKNDPECRRLLGDGRIKAYGEGTSNKWARNRPIAASQTADRDGTEHILMHFNVEGDLDRGVVRLHLYRKPGEADYTYQYLFLDLPGKTRVELENRARLGEHSGRKTILGIRWK